MMDIRIFEHDAQGQLISRLQARSGRIGGDGQRNTWVLQDVDRSLWPQGQAAALLHETLPELAWPTTLDEALVAAATSPIGGMSTADLWRYGRHLTDQEQTSQRYDLQFWKRAFYPFACIVMVALALPFGYLHSRAGGVSLKVFGGIMLGISFILLNNVVGHLGLLHAWTPWMAASVPSLLYLALSLAAFGWLVRYR
jgi:lipopolysaccharide export system permease protein